MGWRGVSVVKGSGLPGRPQADLKEAVGAVEQRLREIERGGEYAFGHCDAEALDGIERRAARGESKRRNSKS